MPPLHRSVFEAYIQISSDHGRFKFHALDKYHVNFRLSSGIWSNGLVLLLSVAGVLPTRQKAET